MGTVAPHTTVARPTPTPWSVDPVSKLDINGPENYGDVAVCLAREMDSIVIKCNTVGPSLRSQAKANAAYIVHCVNSFDALTEANKKLVAALRDLYQQVDSLATVEFNGDLPDHEAEACWDDAVEMARVMLDGVTK